MSLKFLNIFKNIDWLLLVAVFLLVCFGLSSIFSLGLSQHSNFGLFGKQVLFSLIGILFLFIFISFDYRWWRSLSSWIYLVSVILLVLLFWFGKEVNGAKSWFIFGSFSFQPIELAKLSVIMVLARFFSSRAHLKYNLKIWWQSFLIILPISVLAFLQPDFGSVLVVVFIWFAMLWLSGLKKKHLWFFLGLVILLAIFGWRFGLQDYQKQRIAVFLNPELAPLGAGYNVRQSMIAIGSGQFFGRGLGLGTQSQLRFLPISEADFIFSSLAEEMGFVGVFFIFVLFFILFYRLFKIMNFVRDDFGAFLIFGLSAMFFIQMTVNIGMTLGLLPVTGLPLPFVSYGGSFLVISLLGIGIVESIKRRY